jgi:hypothetical protein
VNTSNDGLFVILVGKETFLLHMKSIAGDSSAFIPISPPVLLGCSSSFAVGPDHPSDTTMGSGE